MYCDDPFDRVPPYGSGAAPYTREDLRALAELHRTLELLLGMLEGDSVYHLDLYLKRYRAYQERVNRYYFYRGVYHGSAEAMDARQGEHPD